MDNTGGAERDWTKPHRLAAGVYAMRGGQILLLERARGMMLGFWSVPGGIVDPGETPQEAAARELVEEAGITPTGPLWLVTAVPLKGYNSGAFEILAPDAGGYRRRLSRWGQARLPPAFHDTAPLLDSLGPRCDRLAERRLQVPPALWACVSQRGPDRLV
jgi:8-oxo-dGTP pyrophosphatase MutT (NUDIX family)